MNVTRTIVLVLLLQIASGVWAVGTATWVTADSLMHRLFSSVAAKEYSVGESLSKLYVKQYANLDKWHIGLNFIPGMTRFDRKEKNYLTELFYDVHFLDYALPAVRRIASVTTHRHGSGEMDRVMGFMQPSIFAEELFMMGYLSPLHKVNSRYYKYSIDETPDSLSRNGRFVKISYKTKIDNIKLLKQGWILLDDSCRIHEFYAEGWDEQSSFKILCKLGKEGLERNLAHTIDLCIEYGFAWNKLEITATGVYDYELLVPYEYIRKKRYPHNLTGVINNTIDVPPIKDRDDYIIRNRQIPLTASDSALYIKKGVIGRRQQPQKAPAEEDKNIVVDWLWTFGDQMISSHSLNWEGGNLKLAPIVKPSYLSYSSSRGLSYKTKLYLNHRMKNGRSLSLVPMLGYNFKQNAFYWEADGHFRFDPLRLGEVIIDVGSGNRTFSSVALEQIKHIAYDSLNFKNLDLNYFNNLYVNVGVKREISNGLELLVGINYHRRKMINHVDDRLTQEGIILKRKYAQFAPHISVTWHPGMYYYIKNGAKINIGSRLPRFTIDVEQGVRHFLGATGEYTRAELDIQYNYKVNETNALYLRGGGGGFIYTHDVYFADYAFLRHNNLPLDRSDELDGTFQLLDSEWYNAANRYMRFHATYESPFLVFQRLFPRVNFIKYERIYFNSLFISHLTPYIELGYGVETPYIDGGFFIGFENGKFNQLGYKFNLSLFRD